VKRAPTTFSLLLGLLAATLAIALALAAGLSMRASRHIAGETYGHLVAATVIATDELSRRTDPAAHRALAALDAINIRVESGAPPASRQRIAPIVHDAEKVAGKTLGDPSRITVVQAPDAQIWVRSTNDPARWITLHALGYRREVRRSSLLATLIAGLVALIGAATAARRLTRPLERLSANAGPLLAGAPMQETLANSPREVCLLADAIVAAGERQRNAARERELMLAGISHDLRTPLARLRLALELGDAEDPQRRKAMVADLEQLDDALGQCLAFVRDGNDEPLREIDVATLAGQLLSTRMHPDEWRLDVSETLHATVRPTLLRRAVNNLMDNAERHGRPPFALNACHDHGTLVLRISDHGPGVDEALLERLGQPFLRADRARTSAGSGLGLSIVKRAAELHGGTLRLQLRKPDGSGMVATIRIPNAIAGGQRGSRIG
jgi:two-component system osmolarity sensor histidine kinase EnvZ